MLAYFLRIPYKVESRLGYRMFAGDSRVPPAGGPDTVPTRRRDVNLNTRNPIRLVAILAIALLAVWALNGCSERTLADLELASADDNPVVFEDEFLDEE